MLSSHSERQLEFIRGPGGWRVGLQITLHCKPTGLCNDLPKIKLQIQRYKDTKIQRHKNTTKYNELRMKWKNTNIACMQALHCKRRIRNTQILCYKVEEVLYWWPSREEQGRYGPLLSQGLSQQAPVQVLSHSLPYRRCSPYLHTCKSFPLKIQFVHQLPC